MVSETAVQEITEMGKSLEEKPPELVREILQRITEAQADLSKENMSVKILSRHLRTKLYPILASSLNKLAELSDVVEDSRADEEFLSLESTDFIRNYVEAVFSHINSFLPSAQKLAEQGDDSLLRDLQALYNGGKAVKGYVTELCGEEEVIDGQ